MILNRGATHAAGSKLKFTQTDYTMQDTYRNANEGFLLYPLV